MFGWLVRYNNSYHDLISISYPNDNAMLSFLTILFFQLQKMSITQTDLGLLAKKLRN